MFELNKWDSPEAPCQESMDVLFLAPQKGCLRVADNENLGMIRAALPLLEIGMECENGV